MKSEVLILMILILPAIGAFGFWGSEDFYVELSPNDPKVCTTQNITLTCVCTDLTRFNSSNINLTVGGNEAIEYKRKIINESAAQITIGNLKPNTYPNVCCKEKGNTGLGECQIVRTFDYPAAIVNLSCVVNDWSENMNCTWEPGANYVIKPKTSFEWRLPYNDCRWFDCPDINRKYNYCFWNSTAGKDFSTKAVDFRVKEEAKCGEVATSYYTINTKTIVKPAPMAKFLSEVINSTCVRVTWESTRREYIKIYEVWHTSNWNDSKPSQKQIFDSNVTGTEQKNKAIFCELVPATKYTFYGRVKPGYKYWSSPTNIASGCGNCSCSDTRDEDCECLKNSGYWSDETQGVVTTYGDVPGASPDVSPGGYWWKTDDCEDNKGYRRVSFYWKLLDELHQNGEIREYIMKLTSLKDNITGSGVAGDTNSYTRKLMCDTDYHVSIQPRNVNGTSKEVSSLVILASTKGVYPPSFMVEMSNVTDEDRNRTVHIQVSAASRPDVLGFTVFWCKKDQGKCAIRSEVFWKTFGPDVNSVDLQITSPENYLYSVSMETEIGSSGMTWKSCIYTKDVEPKDPPSDVKVLPGPENRELLVNWEGLSCKSGEPYISEYEVKFCRGVHCDAVTTTDSFILLRNLEADVPYTVRVRGVTLVPLYGPWSEPVKETPIDKSLSTGEITWIVIGSCFGLVLIIAGVILIVKKCWHKVKKTVKKDIMVPINLPDLADGVINETYIQEESIQPDEGKIPPVYITQLSEYSSESGYGEGNSPDSSRGSGFFSEHVEEERKKEQEHNYLQHQSQIANQDYVQATELSPTDLVPKQLSHTDMVPKEPIIAHVHMVTCQRLDRIPENLTQEDPVNLGSANSASVSPYTVAVPGMNTASSEYTDIFQGDLVAGNRLINETKSSSDGSESTVGGYVQATQNSGNSDPDYTGNQNAGNEAENSNASSIGYVSEMNQGWNTTEEFPETAVTGLDSSDTSNIIYDPEINLEWMNMQEEMNGPDQSSNSTSQEFRPLTEDANKVGSSYEDRNDYVQVESLGNTQNLLKVSNTNNTSQAIVDVDPNDQWSVGGMEIPFDMPGTTDLSTANENQVSDYVLQQGMLDISVCDQDERPDGRPENTEGNYVLKMDSKDSLTDGYVSEPFLDGLSSENANSVNSTKTMTEESSRPSGNTGSEPLAGGNMTVDYVSANLLNPSPDYPQGSVKSNDTDCSSTYLKGPTQKNPTEDNAYAKDKEYDEENEDGEGCCISENTVERNTMTEKPSRQGNTHPDSVTRGTNDYVLANLLDPSPDYPQGSVERNTMTEEASRPSGNTHPDSVTRGTNDYVSANLLNPSVDYPTDFTDSVENNSTEVDSCVISEKYAENGDSKGCCLNSGESLNSDLPLMNSSENRDYNDTQSKPTASVCDGYVSETIANQLSTPQREDQSDNVSAQGITEMTSLTTADNDTNCSSTDGYLPHSFLEEQGSQRTRTAGNESIAQSSENGYIPHDSIEKL